MFTLLNKDTDNPPELFQIWLNLPQANKFVEPHFAMLWADAIPRRTVTDDAGRETEVEIIAGRFEDVGALPPPPDSWAADPQHHVAIWIIRMQPGACWSLPATEQSVNRTLYFFDGESMQVEGETVKPKNGLVLQPDVPVVLENAKREARLLLLQGKPIAEPVVQYGPFVMNTRQEIQQAFTDYQQTQFGGWPWPDSDQVHGRDKGRFARHADGKEETRSD